MISEFIKQHPNPGKVLVYTEAYLQIRQKLIEQIGCINMGIQGTALQNDCDIERRLLPNLKRTLKGLEQKFERAGVKIAPEYCAQLIAEYEREQINDPLSYCRYYKEGNNVENVPTNVIYQYEEMWVQFILNRNNERYFVEMITEYMYHGLLRFPECIRVPVSLMALLFNRFEHWSEGSTESFKEWYFANYKNIIE